MKFTSSFAVLVALICSSCSDYDQPPVRTVQRRPAKYPIQSVQASEYPPQQQPFADATPPPPNTIPQETSTHTEMTTETTEHASPEGLVKGDYPYGVPVPGKPGFVKSPYSPDKITDVRDIPPGTPVKDPYTGKVFLVP